MARIAGMIVIARPVEVVFHCVADQRNEPKYNPRMVRSEKLTDGPIGVGTRFGATMTAGRRRTDMVIETTEYDRPRRLASKTTMDMADVAGSVTFDQTSAGTVMRWSWDVHPRGVARLFSPLIAAIGRRQERTIWGGLKQYLESVSAPSSAVDQWLRD